MFARLLQLLHIIFRVLHTHSPHPTALSYSQSTFISLLFPSRGRILGHNCNWDKSLESFPLCYSQSPLLTDLTPPPPLSESCMTLVYNVNIVYEPQVGELSRLCLEASTKLYVHEFGFRLDYLPKCITYSH
jgi:hypothetical protein